MSLSCDSVSTRGSPCRKRGGSASREAVWDLSGLCCRLRDLTGLFLILLGEIGPFATAGAPASIQRRCQHIGQGAAVAVQISEAESTRSRLAGCAAAALGAPVPENGHFKRQVRTRQTAPAGGPSGMSGSISRRCSVSL